MDDEVSGVGSTLTPKDLAALRTLARIRRDGVSDVVAQKRRVAAVEAKMATIEADINEILAVIKLTTDRVLQAIGQQDRRGQERPA